MGGKIIAIVLLVAVVVVLFYAYTKIDFSKVSSGLHGFSWNTSTTISSRPTSSQTLPSFLNKPPTLTPTSTKPITQTPTSTINPKDIPEGFTLEQLSPYFRQVRLSSVSPGYGSGYGYVVLSTSFPNASTTVDITNWRIQGNRGAQYVPGAVNSYDPSGLASESDIYMRRGTIVRIYSTTSPIGRNLRLNKCIGYLETVLNFTPPLPLSCPQRDLSEVGGFTGKCQDYIRSISSCGLPKDNPPIPLNDYACFEYLKTINYRGCYDAHRSDADFLGSEFRVWTGSKFLDERHDQVRLFDARGLLVDTRSY